MWTPSPSAAATTATPCSHTDAAICSSCRGTDISGTLRRQRIDRLVDCHRGLAQAGTALTASRRNTIAIVALDEGPWTYAWIAGALDESEKRARVRYDRMIAGERYPLFVRQ